MDSYWDNRWIIRVILLFKIKLIKTIKIWKLELIKENKDSWNSLYSISIQMLKPKCILCFKHLSLIKIRPNIHGTYLNYFVNSEVVVCCINIFSENKFENDFRSFFFTIPILYDFQNMATLIILIITKARLILGH